MCRIDRIPEGASHPYSRLASIVNPVNRESPVNPVSRPISAIERAIADSFSNVRRKNSVGSLKVGNGATHFQDSIVRASRKTLPRHRCLKKSFTFRIEMTVTPDQPRGHLSVCENPFSAEAEMLNLART